MKEGEKTKQAIAIRSLGCRTNQEEMFILAGELCEKGFKVVDNVSEASIVIVNTCTVTSAAESKTKRLINYLLKSAPNANLLITGCVAEQKPEFLKKIEKRVKWIVGNVKKGEISSIIEKEEEGIFCSSLKESSKKLSISKVIPDINNLSIKRTRFPVKIQEGCDFSCSYCIVPKLRGPSRSAEINEIIEIVSKAIEKGFKEIVLTGTHIGQYKDTNGNRLLELIEKIVNLKGDFRVRLSSLDPRDCSSEILNYVVNHNKMCKHIHVSLQSCSPDVLRRMNRSPEFTMSVIDQLIKLRESVFNISIGADLIVGFPNENEKEFEETCDKVEKLKLSYAHIFRFSRRDGTTAMNFENQVEEKVKSVRSEILRKIVDKSKKVFIKKINGTKDRIIVETTKPIRGVTSNYVKIEIPDYSYGYNEWLDVIITDKYKGRYFIGKPLLKAE